MMEKIKLLYQNNKTLILEFIRYCVVGGTAFIFDTAAYIGLVELVFVPKFGREYMESYSFEHFFSITVGFIVGLIVNYVLSMLWVFTSKKQQKQGKNARAFTIFAVIGVIGYFLKQLLMYIQLDWLFFTPWIANIIAAGIVLIWNYLARKVIIFKKDEK
ncbi:MAG: GtrA family protein [Eubacteriales bacterium]|nr:GtrA family protein [Eubacteriales bacterium]MDD4475247.1 GtrA family protein [Eubacteriales bacterium]